MRFILSAFNKNSLARLLCCGRYSEEAKTHLSLIAQQLIKLQR